MKQLITYRQVYRELADAEVRHARRRVLSKTTLTDTRRPGRPGIQYDNAPGMRKTLTVEDNSSLPYLLEDMESLFRNDVDSNGRRNKYPVARSRTGKYIGDPDMAKQMVEKYGITEFYTTHEVQQGEPGTHDSVVCVGRSPDGWVGWSHRAIYKFKPGMVVKQGDCGYEYVRKALNGKPWVLKTDEDACRAASYFARSVS